MLLVPAKSEAGKGEVLGVARRLEALSPADAHLLEMLALAPSEPNAFAESWFLGPALAHLRRDREVWLIAAHAADDGTPVGALPVTIYSRYGRMSVRHVENWAHYQCFMGTPLVAAGWEESFWQAALRTLDAADWAPGFLSITGLLEDGPVHRGLAQAAAGLGRPCATVHRYERAALASGLDAQTYLATHVRAKKRKELRRLANRLAELGEVRFSTLDSAAHLKDWCETFLELEAGGWKGERGAALANAPETAAFFHQAIAGAQAAGKLDFQRLDLAGRAIAMLINFNTPPGSWSFKIAYDEGLARFSPGVMIELENLARVLGNPDIAWMDSCASANHPMIDSLWAERRGIVQVTVPLAGARRRAIHALCRAAERASAALRGARNGANDDD